VQRNVSKRVARRKSRVRRRLERARRNRFRRGLEVTPVIVGHTIRHEPSHRPQAISHGGVGLMLRLARSMGPFDGPVRWARSMGPFDGPVRWARSMGLVDGPGR
jgi:hypothetical protein